MRTCYSNNTIPGTLTRCNAPVGPTSRSPSNLTRIRRRFNILFQNKICKLTHKIRVIIIYIRCQYLPFNHLEIFKFLWVSKTKHNIWIHLKNNLNLLIIRTLVIKKTKSIKTSLVHNFKVKINLQHIAHLI